MVSSVLYILYPQIGATVSHQFITKPDVLVNNPSFSHIREIMVLELFYQERDNEKI